MDAVALLGPLAKVRDNVIVTRETQYFAQSGTFVAPADGIAIFRVLGAGGSGASSGQTTPGSGGNGGHGNRAARLSHLTCGFSCRSGGSFRPCHAPAHDLAVRTASACGAER